MKCPICKNKYGFVCSTCCECGYNYSENKYHTIQVDVDVLKRFEHNGYKIRCHNCGGTGQVHHNKETLLEVCKVQINTIKVSITNDNTISVRYKVSGIDCNARNRAETTLFKSLEETKEYCKLVNTKQNAPEF